MNGFKNQHQLKYFSFLFFFKFWALLCQKCLKTNQKNDFRVLSWTLYRQSEQFITHTSMIQLSLFLIYYIFLTRWKLHEMARYFIWGYFLFLIVDEPEFIYNFQNYLKTYDLFIGKFLFRGKLICRVETNFNVQ
jgi:hypothetical protein